MRRTLGLYAVVLALASVLLVVLDARSASALISHGRLVDTDSHMRVVRLREVLDQGGWKAGRVLRDNWPDGFEMHWTMVYDLPVLAVTRALVALGAEPSTTLVTVAGLSGPASLLLLVLGIAWALRPIGERAALVGAALAASSIPLVAYGGFGRADHHVATIVPLAFAVGHGVRAVPGGGPWLHGLAGGLWLALAMWTSVESLPAVVALLALAAARRLEGGPAGALSWTALSLALGVTVMLGFDPPPPGHGGAIDRLSSVFRDFAACSAAALIVTDGLAALKTQWVRIPGAVAAALGAAVLWLALHREVLGGFETSMGAELAGIIGPTIAELRAVRSMADVVQYAGLGLAGVIGGVAGLLLRPEQRVMRSVVVLAVAASVVLSLQHLRFGTYASFAGALVLGAVLGPLLRDLAAPTLRGTVGWIALLQPLLSGLVVLLTPAPPAAPGCDVVGAARRIPGPPAAVLAEHPAGPFLLYHSEHRTLAGPYHWNVDGLGDLYRSLLATDDRVAREVVARRGFDWILVCARAGDPALASVEAPNFYDQLRAGEDRWDWLEPAAWEGERTGYRLWKVVPPPPAPPPEVVPATAPVEPTP